MGMFYTSNENNSGTSFLTGRCVCVCEGGGGGGALIFKRTFFFFFFFIFSIRVISIFERSQLQNNCKILKSGNIVLSQYLTI